MSKSKDLIKLLGEGLNNVIDSQDGTEIARLLKDKFGGDIRGPYDHGDRDDGFQIVIDSNIGEIIINNDGIEIEYDKMTGQDKMFVRGIAKRYDLWINGDKI